jgi:ribulose-5-phosphate 4-epimerase/fuculose-1-phosphate aldolase
MGARETMMTLAAMNAPSVRDRVSAAEWETRVELAAFYRVVSGLGMTDLIHNHITARVPGTLDAFLINPFGLDYAEITASSLLKIDLDGELLPPSPRDGPVNRAGFVVHSAIHAARHDLACVAHTHTRAGVAVASLECGLLPLNQNALRFEGDLAYHDYEGPALNLEERARLVADLGDCDNMILRNHGLIAAGSTVAQAYINLVSLETACRMQVDALSCGQPLRQVSPEAVAASRAVYAAGRRPNDPRMLAGTMEWTAARRRLDAASEDYKT